MVDAQDDCEDEETEYNAIDCHDDEDFCVEEEDEGDLADFGGTKSGIVNPRHLMRLLRTQSMKRMGAMKL
eukprot:CAMPEP_0170467362 /NCGR_PEP_ID=MMETSP0123-20130129/10970_1 /TAXON_ID=182087 /ORGANISM="Favella ehrenbergii, Strain Fehren 1" /LENGTH=69 /DNA_ID=CAMNT_0010733711 /DNA_START=45 /DNA_END=254 /DNA_ORIENTATION=-